MEKERTFKLIKANNSYEEAICQLDQSWDISAELFQKIPEITCRTSVPSINATSVNDVHLVKTACLCIYFMLTTRLQFGGAACSTNSKWNWITTDDNGQLAFERMRSSPAPDVVCNCSA